VHSNGAATGLSAARLPLHEEWEKRFPVDLVVEMNEQVRLWFYAMLYVSVVLTGKAPYKEVVTYSKVLDKKGEPMHKSAGNSVKLDDALVYGADCLRWFYLSNPLTKSLKFNLDEVKKSWRDFHMFSNAAKLYLDNNTQGKQTELDNLDNWLLARVTQAGSLMQKALEKRDTMQYVVAASRFMRDFSQVYVRANREKYKAGDVAALKTTQTALSMFCVYLAPAVPFYADTLYQLLGHDNSVHLSPWPNEALTALDQKLLTEFAAANSFANDLRNARQVANVPLRQPLGRAVMPACENMFSSWLAKETNVWTLQWDASKTEVYLDTNLTDELKQAGLLRQFVRLYRQARKNAGLQEGELCTLMLFADNEDEFVSYLKTLSGSQWEQWAACVRWVNAPLPGSSSLKLGNTNLELQLSAFCER
jgi:isoleucyl-tRNA synthetase